MITQITAVSPAGARPVRTWLKLPAGFVSVTVPGPSRIAISGDVGAPSGNLLRGFSADCAYRRPPVGRLHVGERRNEVGAAVGPEVHHRDTGRRVRTNTCSSPSPRQTPRERSAARGPAGPSTWCTRASR